jgi:MFS transporter, DHA2 family, multidrug resistance protein
VVAAGELPAALGTALFDAARRAFTDGLRLTSAISAALSLALAVLTAVLLTRGCGQPDPLDPANRT